jgi:hypothetical protein
MELMREIMLKRKYIPIEESIKKACKENGLIYDPNGTTVEIISIIDDDGNEISIDRDMNIVKIAGGENGVQN